MDNEMVNLVITCPFCGENNSVRVKHRDYVAWLYSDTPVQDIFFYLSAEEREMLISGICPTCWHKAFFWEED